MTAGVRDRMIALRFRAPLHYRDLGALGEVARASFVKQATATAIVALSMSLRCLGRLRMVAVVTRCS
jgi:hypothetical protein